MIPGFRLTVTLDKEKERGKTVFKLADATQICGENLPSRPTWYQNVKVPNESIMFSFRLTGPLGLIGIKGVQLKVQQWTPGSCNGVRDAKFGANGRVEFPLPGWDGNLITAQATWKGIEIAHLGGPLNPIPILKN